ncbi:MAG: RsmB/NOP family class I SAM-dependent RNA methyltransferase [Clostridia bacterium]|nr:RsmB/NOP family class I SAM-dependent RNA methyltransferase [Clostridia bacterium]
MQDFLEKRIRDEYDPDTASRILEGFKQERRTCLRVNRLKSNCQDISRDLNDAGVEFTRVSWYEDAFVLEANTEDRVRALPLYEQGLVYLQNLSSMIPPLLLDPQKEENILDMAAAPGGKTTQMAAMTDNLAMITACERNTGRAERLKHNLEVQNARRVTVMTKDARNLESFFRFDRILLDAPCSGSGTVTPFTKGTFSEENLKKTGKLQREMLEKALSMLPSGHDLVYSTCSILKEENERVIEKHVKNGMVSVVPFDRERFATLPLLPVDIAGTLCICPTDTYEGFFAARLRKNK